MRRRFTPTRCAGLIACCLLAAVLSGCGSAELGTSLLARANIVKPGYDSPGAAVAGFFDGAATKDQSAACSYVPSQEQSLCKTVKGLGATLPAGGLQLGATARRGPLALVVLLGRVCLLSSGHHSCLTNHDRRAGLPSASTSFANAMRRALKQAKDPATLCIEENGRWYADMFS